MEELGTLDDLVALVDRSEGLYVRFSDGPEADAAEESRDYESDLPLPGLSANRLDPPDWWSRPLVDWLARQLCQYAHLTERSRSHRGWILTGHLTARGPDDEPLLTDIRPVAWLSATLVAQAQEWYRHHFNVGCARR